MALLVGVLLAVAVGILGRTVGFDRDRSFYPVVTIVVASYYALFAVMGASTGILLAEVAVGAVFLVAAVIGFRGSLWLVVIALAGHGVQDLVHGRLIDNPGVPTWWPAWCLGYDVAAAAFLAWLLHTRRVVAAT